MSILDEIRNRTTPKAVPERQDIFQEQALSPDEQQEEIIVQSDYRERSAKGDRPPGILEDNRAQACNKSTPEPTFISELEQLRLKLSQFPEIEQSSSCMRNQKFQINKLQQTPQGILDWNIIWTDK